MSLVAQKAALRKFIGENLTLLTNENILEQSQKVIRQVLCHPAYIKAERISVYLSTANEINTIPILEDAFKSSKTCFVPRFEPKTNIMQMLRITDMEDYKNLPVIMWNIKQPKASDDREDAFLTGGLDLVIMPGVAFTKDGRRLGHGKGYYDTFLAKFDKASLSKPYAMGLALKEQIVDDLPTTEYDYKLDAVLYPD